MSKLVACLLVQSFLTFHVLETNIASCFRVLRGTGLRGTIPVGMETMTNLTILCVHLFDITQNIEEI